MRQILLFAAIVGACGAGAITVQNDTPSTVRTPDGTLVVNTAPPKYTLNEAIEICIAELGQRGEKISAGAVKNRLQRMPKSDVDLNVKGLSRTIREMIEAHEAANMKNTPPPDPAKFATREKFVAAYLAWKQGGLTSAEKKEIHAQIGGDVKFRNDAKEEANEIWSTKKGNDEK